MGSGGLEARLEFSQADLIVCPPPKMVNGDGQLKKTTFKNRLFFKAVILMSLPLLINFQRQTQVLASVNKKCPPPLIVDINRDG